MEQSPEEDTRISANQESATLALNLAQSGDTQRAAGLIQQIVETESSRHGIGSKEHIQALLKWGIKLTELEQLEAAETYVQQSIDLGDGDSRQAAYEQLSFLRDLQKKPAEAEQFRNLAASIGSRVQSATRDFDRLSRLSNAEDNLDEVRSAINEDEPEKINATARRALAVAAQQRSNPERISRIAQFVPMLVRHNRKDDAIRLLQDVIAVIGLLVPPDHPVLAIPLASLQPAYESLGWAAEFDIVLDRMESILISSKGPDSPALNQIGSLRVKRFRKVGDDRAAVLESQAMLGRSEAAQGMNSEMAMESLHHLAATFQAAGDWQSERAVWQDLLRRSERARGTRSEEHRRLVDEVTQMYALRQGRNNGHTHH